MTINRRRFLAAGGLTAAAVALPATRSGVGSTLASAPPTGQPDWPEVRDQFAVSPDYIHLSSFFLASHPRPVREAIERHRRAIDDNPFLYVERHMFEMPGRIRASAAEYLGGRPEEVALTNSTTRGRSHPAPSRRGCEA
jgi:selenocysteine lyase/cysteine desulfurase